MASPHPALSIVQELKACGRSGDLAKGKLIHAGAVKDGLISNIFVASALISMYAKCGSMVEARTVFDGMRYHDVVALNALIFGYAENGEESIALKHFSYVTTPSALTFVAALKACASIASKNASNLRCDSTLFMAMALHSRASSFRCDSDIRVQSSLVDLYTKCGSLVDAQIAFSRMQQHDVIAWNALLFGYAENGESKQVLKQFVKMQVEGFVPNSRTFVALLKACTNLAEEKLEVHQLDATQLENGIAVHWHAVRNKCDSNAYVVTTLIDMYAKCGSMIDAWRSFEAFCQPPVEAWNALITGYVDNGESSRALELFFNMEHASTRRDCRTYLAAVRACGMLGALQIGRELHSEIVVQGIMDNDENSVLLGNCLVDFYAKCGSMPEAQRVFDSLPIRNDLVGWNSLFTGYCRLGDTDRVLKLFNELPEHLRTNRVVFSCVLSSCSHVGLVKEGRKYFKDMVSKHGVQPDIEHYNCMIDMLGRSNQLGAAMALLRSMPLTPSVVTWMTILDACCKWKNVVLGQLAFSSLLSIECNHGGAFVLMANILQGRDM